MKYLPLVAPLLPTQVACVTALLKQTPQFSWRGPEGVAVHMLLPAQATSQQFTQ